MQGKEYWTRERQICSQMLTGAKRQKLGTSGGQPGFTLDDVHAISAAKSFDYRVSLLLSAPASNKAFASFASKHLPKEYCMQTEVTLNATSWYHCSNKMCSLLVKATIKFTLRRL